MLLPCQQLHTEVILCKITIHPLFWFCEKQIWDFLISLSSLCSYRYTLDDLFPMMTAVKKRAELYDDWASLVMETLEAKLEKKKGKCKKKKKKLFVNITCLI